VTTHRWTSAPSDPSDTGNACSGSGCRLIHQMKPDYLLVILRSRLPHIPRARGDTIPLTILGVNGIYRNARGDGTMQVPPEVPNQTDANFVLNVMTG
jgi:hypothetical protein